MNKKDKKDNKDFKYLENIAIADVAFEAYGSTLSEVFKNAAKAIINLITDISKINNKITVKLNIKSEDIKSLLYDFIGEILYYMDSKSLVFRDVEVIEIKKKVDGYNIKAKLFGQKIDDNVPVKCEVKAPTYHQMVVKRISSSQYYIRMVVDV